MEMPTNQDTRLPGSPGVWRKIWKYRLHYVLVFPPLLLLLVLKGFPLITGIVLAFKQYTIFNGVFGSPWAGTANFAKVLESPQFGNVLGNTLVIKLEYVIISAVLGLLAALLLSGIAGRRLKGLLSTVVLLPYFVPSVVAAYGLMLLLSASRLEKHGIQAAPLLHAGSFQIILVVVEAVKTCGIPILLALAAIEAKRRNAHTLTARSGYARLTVVPAIRAVAAFAILQLSTLLSTDLELLWSLINPLVYETADTIDTFTLRAGLFTGNYAEASALWLLQFVLQLVGTLMAYFLVRRLFQRDLFPVVREAEQPGSGGRSEETNDRTSDADAHKPVRGGGAAAGFVTLVLFSLAVLALVYFLCVYPFTLTSHSGRTLWDVLPMQRYVLYLLLTLAVVLANMVLTAMLAYPLTVNDLPGRGIYKLLVLVVMTSGTGSISEYIMFKSLGMINTVFPQLLLGLFTIVNVFVVKAVFASKYAGLKEEASRQGHGEGYGFFMIYVPKMAKTFAALGVLQFVALWNSYVFPSLYATNPNGFSPALSFRSMMIGGDRPGLLPGDPVILQVAAAITLPSLLLLVLFRKWLTSEVLLSQIRKL